MTDSEINALAERCADELWRRIKIRSDDAPPELVNAVAHILRESLAESLAVPVKDEGRRTVYEALDRRMRDEGRGWDSEHFVYRCRDGEHGSFWRTVIESPEWEVWEKEVARRLRRLTSGVTRRTGPVFDVDECQACGWISPEHFAAFLSFCRTTKARNALRAIRDAEEKG